MRALLRGVCRLFALSLFALAAGCATPSPSSDSTVREELAPGGTLRVALVVGSPTQLLKAADGDRGVMADLGRRLASDLGVVYEQREYASLADALDAVRSGTADLTLTNASPARRQTLGFSQTVLSIELGYLVNAASALRGADEIDRIGKIIAVTSGSTSEITLPKLLKQAAVIPALSLADAGTRLQRGEADGIATNKAQLFNLSDTLPGTRVLDGNWGMEHLAFAVPKKRLRAAALLDRWLAKKASAELITVAVKRAGIRGRSRPVTP